MALTNGQNATKQAMVDAVAAKLEELNAALIDTLPDEASKQKLRDGYRNIGTAIAEVLSPICVHISTNAEVDGEPNLVT
jgi:hypothetical protein